MAGTFVTAGASARKIQRCSALCTLYAIIAENRDSADALLPYVAIIRNDDFVHRRSHSHEVNTRMPWDAVINDYIVGDKSLITSMDRKYTSPDVYTSRGWINFRGVCVPRVES